LKVIVIGSGFSGLSVATSLADKGYEVTILEKNSVAGGRARVFQAEGFTFDMGPSWYWMPDIFDNYFAKFNKKTSDYYDLVRLDPSYSVILEGNETINLPASIDKLGDLFESMEVGSKEKFQEFLRQAEYKYDVGINQFVWKPSTSITEFLSLKLLYDVVRFRCFSIFCFTYQEVFQR